MDDLLYSRSFLTAKIVQVYLFLYSVNLGFHDQHTTEGLEADES